MATAASRSPRSQGSGADRGGIRSATPSRASTTSSQRHDGAEEGVREEDHWTVRCRRATTLQPTLNPSARRRRRCSTGRADLQARRAAGRVRRRKHNAKYGRRLERLLFSQGEYGKRPTAGRPTAAARLLPRESVGTFDVTGTVFRLVTVPEPWAYYDAQDMAREDGAHTVFHDAIEAVRAQRGANALDAFDGVVFLYAGRGRACAAASCGRTARRCRPANGSAVLHHRRGGETSARSASTATNRHARAARLLRLRPPYRPRRVLRDGDRPLGGGASGSDRRSTCARGARSGSAGSPRARCCRPTASTSRCAASK